MNSYKIVFYINGSRTESIIRAADMSQAKKILEAQYSGKIQYISVTPYRG